MRSLYWLHDDRLTHGQDNRLFTRIRDVRGAKMISPDAKTQAALLLRQARGERPLSEMAVALGTSWPAAQRLENPRHWPSLRQLDRAARACGRRLVLNLE